MTDIALDTPRRPNILVVDDQAGNIQLLYNILKQDFEVCMATNGYAALDICRSQMPDLVLLDLVMPAMDGTEVCRLLKADEATASIPVIFITAQNNPIVEADCLDIGAADFITKPFHPKVVMARVRTQIALKRQEEMLRSFALIDALTGIPNRRQFDAVIDSEWRRCARSGQSLALLMIDIDSFKRFNDHYGHQAGDECLRLLAATLRSPLKRSHDFVARYGGEEFACVLPDTSLEGAIAKAGKLEAAVRALAIPHVESATADVVTISVGVAVTRPSRETPFITIMAQADQALYSAKHDGGGVVRVAAAEVP